MRTSVHTMNQVAMGRGCELCKGEAAVCCPSDSAFLCWNCDAKVHQANFLVARHVRFTVCRKCKSVTGNRVSGFSTGPFSDLCRSCSPSPVDDDLDAVSSSSACASSTKSSAINDSACRRKNGRSSDWSTSVDDFSATKKIQKRPSRNARSGAADLAAEGIFVNWCTRLGIGGREAKHVMRKACSALRLCLAHMTALPFRVYLAASLWFGLRRCSQNSGHTWRALRRLEQISGVPAKLIVSAESKLQLVEKAGKQRRQFLKEGWDES